MASALTEWRGPSPDRAVTRLENARETGFWQVWLNYNQNLLGKLVIVLKRHEEQVARLSAAEWLELHTQVQRTTERLRGAFAPDHFNYAFLQNQDRHVHLHVIPRYAASREVSGIVFDDPDYPDHYAVPGRERRVSPAVLDALASCSRARSRTGDGSPRHVDGR